MMDRQLPTESGLSTRQRGIVEVLLACGALSSVLYVATDVLASMRWEGYRYVDRMASDLFAIGSPTRSFILLPMTLYNVLIIAFGIGVWMSARGKRPLRITATLLVAYGALSWMGLVLFPLRPNNPQSGVVHGVATFGLVVLMFLFIGFGSVSLGKAFRIYSTATIVLVIAGGALSFAQVQRIAAGLPTPWLGVVERTNIYAALLWVAVFAMILLRANRAELPVTGGERPAVPTVTMPTR